MWDWDEFLFGKTAKWAEVTLLLVRVMATIFCIYMFYCFCLKVGETFTKIDEIHKAVVKK
jgi:hypothetical protein